MMGMLEEPEDREKYTEDELVDIVCKYEKLVEEINKIDVKLQKLIITNESDQKSKKSLIFNKKLFMKQKSELYKVHILRHSIICGIPCIYVNPNK